MFKLCIVLFAALAATSAKPTLLASPVAYTAGVPLAYTAPVAPVVPAATSSQYVARNYNGVVAAPYVAAPYTAYPSYAAAYPAYASAYNAAYSAYPYASAAYVV